VALDTKSLPELQELREHLEAAIRLDPEHTLMERNELRDVMEWIELRQVQRKAQVA
jgi:hypothetical protein